MHSPKKEAQNESISTTPPEMPHYNSANIYSRPPLLPGSSNSTENALPLVFAPVTPFDEDLNDNEQVTSETATNSISTTNDSTFIPPFDVNQSSEKWPLCEYCHKTGELSRCSGCRQAYYCNRECQVAHWEVHSIICHPGPPQPHPMPIQQSVYPSPSAAYRAPPTYGTQPYHVQNTQQTHVYANGHGATFAYYPPPVAGGCHRTYMGEDGKEQYYCEECNRYFKNGQSLGGHRSRVHPSRRGPYAGGVMPGYAMPGSVGTTSQRKRRQRPSRARHNTNANGQYICPHCGRQFATGNALGGHISGAHTKKLIRMEQQAQAAAAAAAASGGTHGHYVNPQQRFVRPRPANV